MKCSKWLNRGTALGAVLGLLIGVGTTYAWSRLHDNPRKEANAEVPVVRPAATSVESDKVEREKAYRGCKALETALKAYIHCPQNPGVDEEDKMPQAPIDLVHVPYGGPSLLANGKEDITDPWGKPYKFERRTTDGHVFVLISTTAPDGTMISQFGIGRNARP